LRGQAINDSAMHFGDLRPRPDCRKQNGGNVVLAKWCFLPCYLVLFPTPCTLSETRSWYFIVFACRKFNAFTALRQSQAHSSAAAHSSSRPYRDPTWQIRCDSTHALKTLICQTKPELANLLI
jgi:hypothetical protein